MQTTHHDDSRQFFLDWVRILAFFVLIFYHVGMYYVTWDWHVKSVNASSAIEPLMKLSAPWRLGLLFLVSGVASRWMLNKFSVGSFVRQRSARLLIPLVFGMLVVTPPQAFIEAVEQAGYQGNYFGFMKLYLQAYHGFCDKDGCLDLPTWNHLWFVPYLWLYSLLLAGILLGLGKHFESLENFLGKHLNGWKLLVLPTLLLALIRIFLANRFPTTHDLVDDWFNHANSFTLFLLGALLARQAEFWKRFDASRWALLGTALACWALVLIFDAWPDDRWPATLFPIWGKLYHLIYSLCQWSAIGAACGFAHRHLQFDSPKRRYLTQAVFPLYILHQTFIVVFAYLLKPAVLAPGIEAMVLIVLTMTCSFAVFEMVRRVPLLQPLFGLRGDKILALKSRIAV
jgi:glucan biosynthesis protein C